MIRRLIALVTAVALAGCPSQPATPQAKAQADLVAVAKAVKLGDALCADVATKSHDVKLASKCAEAYSTARSGLILAETGVDAWGAPDAASRLSCGVRAAVEALAITESAVSLPPDAVAGLTLAAQWASLQVGTCPAAVVGDSGADAPSEGG